MRKKIPQMFKELMRRMRTQPLPTKSKSRKTFMRISVWLSKTRVAFLTILLVFAFIPIFFNLPDNIVGHRDVDMVLFMIKVTFLAIAAAFGVSFIIVFFLKRDFFSTQAQIFLKYRYYLQQLIKRDFTNRYRKSVLGMVWSILNPLLTMLVMSLVFSFLFRFDIPNYAIYVLSGQILFSFFNEATTMSMGSIIANESVIKKVYVPKYVFPLSKMLSSFVSLGFSFVAFMLVFVITGVEFSWTMLLIPVPVIYLAVFALGIGLFLSSMVVFFRDIVYLYGVFLTLWMFLTPIMYPSTIIPPGFTAYYGLNPLYQYINYFRNVALYSTLPDLWENMVCIAFSLASLSIGTFVFMRRQDRYILYL